MTPPSLYILLTLNNVENLMSNNTINIALIGYGFVGKTFHAPLIRSVPGLNLALSLPAMKRRSNATCRTSR